MQEQWDQFSEDGYFEFTRQWLSQVCRLVKPNGNILVFGSFHNIYTIGFVLQKLERRILQQITWFKPNAQPNITARLPTESTEYVLWACNNTPRKAAHWTFNYAVAKQINGGKQLRNLWTIPLTPKSERRMGGHPSQKPIAIAERIVESGPIRAISRSTASSARARPRSHASGSGADGWESRRIRSMSKSRASGWPPPDRLS